jgi:hypothetical protein
VAAGVFEQFGQQYGDGHCPATTQDLLTVALGIYSEVLASVCHAVSHCRCKVYGHTPFLMMLKDWAQQIP